MEAESNFRKTVAKFLESDASIVQLSNSFKELVSEAKQRLSGPVEIQNATVEDLLDCMQSYLACIIEYAEGGTAQSRSERLRQLCTNISAVVDELKIKHEFIRKLSLVTFEFLLNQPSWIAKEILRMYNSAIEFTDKNVRSEVMQEKGPYYLGRLLDNLSFGDFEFQLIILETLFRICTKEVLKNMLGVNFLTEELREALYDIDTIEFDLTARKFLNLLNEKEKHVISLLCNKVTFDSYELHEPPELISFKGMWIDVNVRASTITLFINNEKFNKDSTWEMITLFPENILEVNVFYGPDESKKKKEGIAKFILKSPCQLCYATAQHALKSCRTLMLYSINVEKFKEIFSNVFPRIHNKVKQKQRTTLIHKNDYKPLDIVSVKSNGTSGSTMNLTIRSSIAGRKHKRKTMSGKSITFADSTILSESSKSKTIPSKKSLNASLNNSSNLEVDGKSEDISLLSYKIQNWGKNYCSKSRSVNFDKMSYCSNLSMLEQFEYEKDQKKAGTSRRKTLLNLNQTDEEILSEKLGESDDIPFSKYGSKFMSSLIDVEDVNVVGGFKYWNESNSDNYQKKIVSLDSNFVDIEPDSTTLVSGIHTNKLLIQDDKLIYPSIQDLSIKENVSKPSRSEKRQTINQQAMLRDITNQKKSRSKTVETIAELSSAGYYESNKKDAEKNSKLRTNHGQNESKKTETEGQGYTGLAVNSLEFPRKQKKQIAKSSYQQGTCEENTKQKPNTETASSLSVQLSQDLFTVDNQTLDEAHTSVKKCIKFEPKIEKKKRFMGLIQNVSPLKDKPRACIEAFDILRSERPRNFPIEDPKDEKLIEPDLIEIQNISTQSEIFETALTNLVEEESPDVLSIRKHLELFQDISQEYENCKSSSEEILKEANFNSDEALLSKIRVLSDIRIQSPILLTRPETASSNQIISNSPERGNVDNSEIPKILHEESSIGITCHIAPNNSLTEELTGSETRSLPEENVYTCKFSETQLSSQKDKIETKIISENKEGENDVVKNKNMHEETREINGIRKQQYLKNEMKFQGVEKKVEHEITPSPKILKLSDLEPNEGNDDLISQINEKSSRYNLKFTQNLTDKTDLKYQEEIKDTSKQKKSSFTDESKSLIPEADSTTLVPGLSDKKSLILDKSCQAHPFEKVQDKPLYEPTTKGCLKKIAELGNNNENITSQVTSSCSEVIYLSEISINHMESSEKEVKQRVANLFNTDNNHEHLKSNYSEETIKSELKFKDEEIKQSLDIPLSKIQKMSSTNPELQITKTKSFNQSQKKNEIHHGKKLLEKDSISEVRSKKEEENLDLIEPNNENIIEVNFNELKKCEFDDHNVRVTQSSNNLNETQITTERSPNQHVQNQEYFNGNDIMETCSRVNRKRKTKDNELYDEEDLIPLSKAKLNKGSPSSGLIPSVVKSMEISEECQITDTSEKRKISRPQNSQNKNVSNERKSTIQINNDTKNNPPIKREKTRYRDSEKPSHTTENSVDICNTVKKRRKDSKKTDNKVYDEEDEIPLSKLKLKIAAAEKGIEKQSHPNELTNSDKSIQKAKEFQSKGLTNKKNILKAQKKIQQDSKSIDKTRKIKTNGKKPISTKFKKKLNKGILGAPQTSNNKNEGQPLSVLEYSARRKRMMKENFSDSGNNSERLQFSAQQELLVIKNDSSKNEVDCSTKVDSLDEKQSKTIRQKEYEICDKRQYDNQLALSTNKDSKRIFEPVKWQEYPVEKSVETQSEGICRYNLKKDGRTEDNQNAKLPFEKNIVETSKQKPRNDGSWMINSITDSKYEITSEQVIPDNIVMQKAVILRQNEFETKQSEVMFDGSQKSMSIFTADTQESVEKQISHRPSKVQKKIVTFDIISSKSDDSKMLNEKKENHRSSQKDIDRQNLSFANKKEHEKFRCETDSICEKVKSMEKSEKEIETAESKDVFDELEKSLNLLFGDSEEPIEKQVSQVPDKTVNQNITFDITCSKSDDSKMQTEKENNLSKNPQRNMHTDPKNVKYKMNLEDIRLVDNIVEEAEAQEKEEENIFTKPEGVFEESVNHNCEQKTVDIGKPIMKQMTKVSDNNAENNITSDINNSMVTGCAGILKRGRKLYNHENEEENLMNFTIIQEKLEKMNKVEKSKEHKITGDRKNQKKEKKNLLHIKKKNKPENSHKRLTSSKRLDAFYDSVIERMKIENVTAKTSSVPTFKNISHEKYKLDFSSFREHIQKRNLIQINTNQLSEKGLNTNFVIETDDAGDRSRERYNLLESQEGENNEIMEFMKNLGRFLHKIANGTLKKPGPTMQKNLLSVGELLMNL